MGSYSSLLTSLSSNTTYYVRAYTENSVGTSYGNQVSFTTTSVQTIPVVTTTAVVSSTLTTVICGGNVISDGGSTVSARGVCWSTSHNPTTVLTTKTSDGTGTGIFSSTMTGLSASTAYYIRAYATNSTGTSYGAEITTITPGSLYITYP
jgi:hypothetical protein